MLASLKPDFLLPISVYLSVYLYMCIKLYTHILPFIMALFTYIHKYFAMKPHEHFPVFIMMYHFLFFHFYLHFFFFCGIYSRAISFCLFSFFWDVFFSCATSSSGLGTVCSFSVRIISTWQGELM